MPTYNAKYTFFFQYPQLITIWGSTINKMKVIQIGEQILVWISLKTQNFLYIKPTKILLTEGPGREKYILEA